MISQSGLTPGPADTTDMARAVGHVVVGQLFTRPDVARRYDPDQIADDARVAVRGAGVIDEARDVAANRRVADVEAIQLEAPDVPLLDVAPLALQTFTVGDLLAVVGDDTLVLVDRLGRVDAPAMDRGLPPLNHLREECTHVNSQLRNSQPPNSAAALGVGSWKLEVETVSTRNARAPCRRGRSSRTDRTRRLRA